MGDLYAKIMTNKDTLPHSQRRVADYIMSTGYKVAFLTAEELAQRTGVSLATVVRTATGLGFGSYQELRENLADIAKVSYSPTWEELEESWRHPDTEDYFSLTVKNDIEALRQLLTPGLNQAIRNTVEILNDAREIAIIGSRSSRAPAFALYYGLRQFMPHVHFSGTLGGDDLYENLTCLDSQDVLIAISNGYPHYAVQTINAVRFVGKRGVPVILATDNMDNPAVPFASEILHVPGCHTHFSLVPIMTVLNTIVVGMGRKRSETSVNTLRSLWKTLVENGITIGKEPEE